MSELDDRLADAISAHVDIDALVAQGKAISEGGWYDPPPVKYVEPPPLSFPDTEALDSKHRTTMRRTFLR